MRFFLIPLLFIILNSCKDESALPAEIIKPAKMKLVMWDFLRADVYASEIIKQQALQNDTSVNMKYQQIIFNHHKVTKDQFYKSYQYYYTHPELMSALLDSISAIQQQSKFTPFNNN